MLATALRAEVAAYLDAHSEEIDSRAGWEVTTEQ